MMQEGGMNLSLNEAEIRKRYDIKECKVVVPKFANSENVMWNSEINDVSAIAGTSFEKNKLARKRRKMKSRRFSRNRFRLGVRKPKKINQLFEESINDENTTNSENSESNTLYNGINWEENLDCDTPFVDEFAPQVPFTDRKIASPVPTAEVLDKKFPEKIMQPPEERPPESVKQEFSIGMEWYLQYGFYDEWYPAKIVEVDWDDQEVLVQITEFKPNEKVPSREWLNMGDERLSKTKPASNQMTQVNTDITNVSGMVIIKEEPESDDEALASLAPDQINTEDEVHAINTPEINNESYKGGLMQTLINFHMTSAMPTPTKTLENGKPSSSQGSGSSGNCKFVIGEDVLAKWSDHRMQKFPAKIKSILGNGKYDVLFYDGFEKTINEDELYKTTPEEVAKYKKANPSEADSFVDMDANSKEARRQRKKKTFDDYVFAKDYKMTKKRVLKSSERFGSSKKVALYPKTSDLKDSSDAEAKPMSRKRMRRRRRVLFGPKRDNPKMKLHMLDMARESLTPKSSNESKDCENFYGFDPTQIEEEVPQTDKPSESKQDTVETNVTLDVQPINITGTDGIIRKSVVVPDSKLPEGWSKHAVLMSGNTWDIFLLSPDGFQIANEGELKRYFGTLPNGGEPPSTLDFIADHEILPKLHSQQKELPVAGTPKIWLRRKSSRGGRRGGRGLISSGPIKSIGRVRTLLPKYRLDQSSPSPQTLLPQPQSSIVQSKHHQTTPGPESDIWKCPNETCDKKFRKESLLQMHIKHYHSELSSLVKSVPNMVDLACARSESNNSDWTPSSDLPKVPQSTVKRILPRPFSSSPNNLDNAEIDITEPPITPVQGPSRSLADSVLLKRQNAIEERTARIKTMLPVRQAELSSTMNIDSDDPESEDDYIEQKKNGSRIFKPGKFRKGGKVVYDSYAEEDKPSLEVTPDGVVIERLKSEEVINCICGYREEDGLMIQCDICMCWQHGLCSNIENESDVPDRYVCNICREPFRVRQSKKYAYALQYLTQGKLPSFNFRSRNNEDISHREMIVKRCFDLAASLHEIKNVDRSLAAKINIAEKADHPKLYLWAKSWDEADKHGSKSMKDSHDGGSGSSPETGKNRTGPEPEAPIDLEECRIRLLDHVEHSYSQIENRLTSLQTQIAALESLDPDPLSSPGAEKVTNQTIQMLLRDLSTISKLAAIS